MAPNGPGAKKLLAHFVVVFVAFLGYSMMITIFTPMLMLPFEGIVPEGMPLAARVILLGTLLMLYPLGQFVGSPFLLALCRKFGRKDIYLFSLAITTLGYAFIATALYARSLGFLCFSVFLTGLSESNISMAMHAITEYSDPKRRTKWIGWIHVSSSGAFLFGPLLAGILIHGDHGSWARISSPFWAIFALLALCFFWEGTFSKQIEDMPASNTSFWKILRTKRIRPVYFVNTLIYFAIFGFFRAYPMDLIDRFHVDVLHLGMAIAFVAVPIVVINLFFIERIIERFSARKTAAAGAIFSGALMVALACLSHSTLALLAVLGGISCGVALCLSANPLLISRSSHLQEEAVALENDETILLGAEAASSFAGGLLAAVFIQLPLVVFGALALFGGLFLIKSRVRRSLRPKS